jgi:hypothetical protein
MKNDLQWSTRKRRETLKLRRIELNTQRSKVAVGYLEVLLRVWDVPCLNLGLKTGYLD